MLRAAIIPLIALVVGVGSPAEAADSLTGHWMAVFKWPDKERDYHFDLTQDGDKLTGTMNSPRSRRAYPITSGSVDGRKIRIKIEREYKKAEVTFEIQAELGDNGVIEGKVTLSGEEFASLRMERLPDPVGTWNMTAEDPDGGSHKAVLTLTLTDEGLGGTMTTEKGDVKIQRADFQRGRLRVFLVVPTDEGEMPIVIIAGFDNKDTLKGEWLVDREGADERIAGTFTATRVVARGIVGDWATEAVTNNATIKGQLTVTKKDGKFTGVYKDEAGEPRDNIKHKSIEVSDKGVTIAMSVNFGENEIDFVIRVAFEDENTLAGKWQVKDAADRTGVWKAKRLGVKKSPQKKKRKVETL